MKIAIIICLTIIICVVSVVVGTVLPTLQQQKYEHLEKMQEKDYELAESQLKLEQEKVRYGK